MSEKKLINSTPYAFIPRPLILRNKPELSVLPLNVMFVSLANIDGVDTSGTAIYEPFLGSYRKDKHTQNMRYYNKYSKKDYIDIVYNFDECRYQGIKYVKGEEVLSADGKQWKLFFVHLTMKGLAKGESCKFEPIN